MLGQLWEFGGMCLGQFGDMFMCRGYVGAMLIVFSEALGCNETEMENTKAY